MAITLKQMEELLEKKLENRFTGLDSKIERLRRYMTTRFDLHDEYFREILKKVTGLEERFTVIEYDTNSLKRDYKKYTAPDNSVFAKLMDKSRKD
jgi:hypothetical protein